MVSRLSRNFSDFLKNGDNKTRLIELILDVLVTSVRIAHRRNKIVVVLKLLPSRAFPVDGRSAGSHARKKIG